MTFRSLAVVIGILVATPALAEGDAAAGETVFKKCAACHTVEAGKNKVGPSLHAVVGRAPAAVEGFKYSKGMMEFAEGKVWDEATLAAYLANPKGVVKGTKMAFAGLKDEGDIANVIAYLAANGE